MDLVVLISDNGASQVIVEIPQQNTVERFLPGFSNGSDNQRSIHFPGHLGRNCSGLGEAQGVNIRSVLRPHHDIHIESIELPGHQVVIAQVVSALVLREQPGIGIALHRQHTQSTRRGHWV